MASIQERLESEKTPSPRVYDIRTLQERAVLRLEGGQPRDLDIRFRINLILRSVGEDAVDHTTVLRHGSPAKVAWGSKLVDPKLYPDVGGRAEDDRNRFLREIGYWYYSHGLIMPPGIRDDFEACGLEVAPPPLTGISITDPDVRVEWRTSSTNVKHVTRWPVYGKDKVQGTAEFAAPNALPDRNSNRLVDKQAWEAFEIELARLKSSYVRAQRVLRLYQTLKGLPTPSGSKVPMPVLIEPVHGVKIVYRSSLVIPQDIHGYLVELLAKRAGNLLWYAPQDAVHPETKLPLPMSPEASSKCYKLLSSKDKKYSSLKGSDIEVLAWQWLLISYNQRHPEAKVALPRNLHFSYERKRQSQADLTAQVQSLTSQVLDLYKRSSTSGIANTESGDKATPTERVVPLAEVQAFFERTWEVIDLLLPPFGHWDKDQKLFCLADRMVDSEAANIRVQKTNDLLAQATSIVRVGRTGPWTALPEDELKSLEEQVGDEILRFLAPSGLDKGKGKAPPMPTVAEVEDEDLPPLPSGPPLAPDTLEVDGHLYILSDESELSSFPFSEFTSAHGRLYRRFAFMEEGRPKAPSKGKPSPAQKPKKGPLPVPKSEGGKSAEGPARREKASPPEKKEGETPKVGVSKGPKDPLVVGNNPLRVKGVPRTSFLSDEQRDSLKKFFEIPEQIDSDSWAAMSKKDRRQATLRRKLPTWAVTAVTRNPENLSKILSGKLTKGNFNEVVQKGRGRQTPGIAKGANQAEIQTAWKAVRDKYPNVAVFSRPQRKAEKEVKKAYDALVAKYGKSPSLPKVKTHPSQAGKGPSSSGSGLGQLGALGPVLKLVNSLILATSGRLGT